jgi:putative aldouronate transport system substrate-binding protein
MKKVRLLSVLLSTIIAATVVSGCKKEDKPAVTDPDGLSPITITMYNEDWTHGDLPFDNPVAKKITEKTGVTLKIEGPVGDVNQKIGIMIASEDYPDIIYAKGNYGKFVEAGALIKLDDYINKYGSNIKDLYGDYLKRLRFSPEDKSTYILGSYGVGAEKWVPDSLFAIQLAVLKDQGYPKLKSLEDFSNAIRTYKQKNPTIDGKETIGISLLADDWRWLITVGNPSGWALGYPDDGQWAVNQENYEATYKFMLPEMREYYRWLNGLNAEGLLDPNSFTQKYDEYKAKIATGRVLGLLDAQWQYDEPQRALVGDGKPERTYAKMPVSLGGKHKDPSMRDQGYSAGWGLGISVKAKNPERIFKFLDWMASDEAQILNNWGVEGEHYTIQNGKRVISDEEWNKRRTDKDYGKKTGVGLYSYPFPQRGDGLKDKTGQTYTTSSVDTIINNYNTAEKEALKAYGVEMWKDIFPPSSDFKVSPYGAAWQINIPADSDLALAVTKADDFCKVNIPRAIMAAPANFDAEWDKIVAELNKLQMDKWSAEFTKKIQDKVKFWND